MPITERPILSVIDAIGTAGALAAATADTNVAVAAVATKYYRIYGLVVSSGIAVTGSIQLECTVTAGTDVILSQTKMATVAAGFTAPLYLMFPEGTYYQGAVGESVTVGVENLTATNTGTGINSQLLYTEHIA